MEGWLPWTFVTLTLKTSLGMGMEGGPFERKIRDAVLCGDGYLGVDFNEESIAMTYKISGLSPDAYAHLFAMDDDQLAAINARRVTATACKGFPCRVSLEDAREGERLILFHHVSHDVATPYRSAYAVYIREAAGSAAEYVDETPPVFDGRPIALRAFDADGNLRNAGLALPGQADARIRELFEAQEIAYIHAHNAAHGCFSAAIERTA
jgi:hypothetical protein